MPHLHFFSSVVSFDMDTGMLYSNRWFSVCPSLLFSFCPTAHPSFRSLFLLLLLLLHILLSSLSPFLFFSLLFVFVFLFSFTTQISSSYFIMSDKSSSIAPSADRKISAKWDQCIDNLTYKTAKGAILGAVFGFIAFRM
jgi:Domain of unknown function (DUF543)